MIQAVSRFVRVLTQVFVMATAAWLALGALELELKHLPAAEAAFIGAVLGELSLQRTLDQASRAGFGTVVGLALGVAGKFAIGIGMIGLFVLQRFL